MTQDARVKVAAFRYGVGMIRTRLFEFFHELRDPAARADPARVQDHFRRYLDLWTRAETRGFDGIFFSEHHFGAAYSPSPNLLVAAMAQRTSSMRLGVLGTVTPYTTPWRMIEEFAMLDQLTGGRFDAGFVSGIPPELGAAGIDMATAGQRHREVVDALRSVLSGNSMSLRGSGPAWTFGEVRLAPTFVQSPLPVWTAAKSNASGARAGTEGWHLCGGFLATSDLATMFDHYRSAACDAGRNVDPSMLAIRRMVHFVDSPADHASGLATAKRSLFELLTESVGPLPPFAAVLDRPDADGSGLSDDEFVTGTPAEVAEQLVEQCKATGVANVAVMFSPTDLDELDRCHALLAEHVIPVLRAASPG